MKQWFILLSIAVLVSACSVLAGDTSDNTTQPDNNTSNQNNNDDALVSWDRDQLAIVFQADVLGGVGYGTFLDSNRVPRCTIYGDGRIVWLTEDDNVLFDLLNDQQIIDFVTYLTIEERFFTYQGGLDSLLPSPEFPITDVLRLNVNDVEHVADSFGNWTSGYFTRVLERCVTLGQQPRIFQPSEGWFTVDSSIFNSTLPSIPWEAEAAGLSLFDVAEMPSSTIWLENALTVPIWTSIREGNGRIQFNQDGNEFLVTFRVPGVTVDAPPPPTGDDQTLVTEEPEPEG